MIAPAVSVSGVSYAYGARQALRDVSFDIAQGTFCALLGPNGAGKSTLVSLLTRLFVAPTGHLAIAGHDLAAAPGSALAALGVVFQQTTLDLDLSVRQNLTYFAALQGLAGRRAHTRIEAALDRLAIADRADEKVRALNGGHRRRAELARALVHEPRVLLLDEPTVGLDAPSRAALTDHVHSLAHDQGITVLWTTHLTDEVRPEDHLLLLHRGALVAEGQCKDVTAGRDLADTFAALTAGASA